MSSSTLAKPTPVRLHHGQQKGLESVGKKFRLKPAALIRQAVDEALERWSHGDPITIRQSTAGKP